MYEKIFLNISSGTLCLALNSSTSCSYIKRTAHWITSTLGLLVSNTTSIWLHRSIPRVASQSSQDKYDSQRWSTLYSKDVSPMKNSKVWGGISLTLVGRGERNGMEWKNIYIYIYFKNILSFPLFGSLSRRKWKGMERPFPCLEV